MATLRTATPADLDAIMAIERAEFPADAWSAEAMAAELRAPHGRYLVAVDAVDAVIGYAGVRVGGTQSDVQTIAVVPERRREGIGRALLVELLAEARRRGATEAFLEVRADNPGARRLYEAHGFAEAAIRRGYYPGGVDAVVMRADLASGAPAPPATGARVIPEASA